MSGFAVIFQRDSSPVDPLVMEAIMARLAHRGPDGSDILYRPGVALGHQHFWATPEERDERQPLADLAGLVHILFDGRLDNRPELLAALDLDTPEGRKTSDAALALQAYRQWGNHAVQRLMGPFALVIYNPIERRILCARDPLGDRTLFYYLDPHLLVVASEPYALLAHPYISGELDEVSLALYFTRSTPGDGRTFFANVTELLPAHVLAVDPAQTRTWQYWQPDLQRRLHYRSDAEYAEHFFSLLQESIRARLRSPYPPAVLMSGGLDSTPIAALAAGQLTNPLTTISYVFDELPQCDEREYIAELTNRYATRPFYVMGDTAWTLHDWPAWPWNPNQPDRDPTRWLTERSLQTAQANGIQALLTGRFGDHLYHGWEDWLADLLAEWRLAESARAAAAILGQHGLAGAWQTPAIRRLGRRLLGQFLPRGNSHPPAWLTPTAAAHYLAHAEQSHRTQPPSIRQAQSDLVLGLDAARGASGEIFHASRYDVDLRYPFRDLRLVNFLLSLPAHQLYRQGISRPILRNALTGRLPEKIRLRQGKTNLEALVLRGLLDREWPTLADGLAAPDALWRHFVRLEGFRVHPLSERRAALSSSELVTLWQCLALEAWQQRLTATSPLTSTWSSRPVLPYFRKTGNYHAANLSP